MEGNLCHSKFTDLNVLLPKCILTETFRIMSGQISRQFGLAKSTHKIKASNYHTLASRKIETKDFICFVFCYGLDTYKAADKYFLKTKKQLILLTTL